MNENNVTIHSLLIRHNKRAAMAALVDPHLTYPSADVATPPQVFQRPGSVPLDPGLLGRDDGAG
ncbi:hypothetical protein, partial [Aquitalea sp.]|uniref:hypothetical protein n=1 Tax=Aquitalea sp. TaxID=1872623 RepID=UPI002590C976